MNVGNISFGIGALIALVVGLLVAVLLLVDEFTLKAAGVAIIALAVARIVP